jgi:hypothetical protein
LAAGSGRRQIELAEPLADGVASSAGETGLEQTAGWEARPRVAVPGGRIDVVIEVSSEITEKPLNPARPRRAGMNGDIHSR